VAISDGCLFVVDVRYRHYLKELVKVEVNKFRAKISDNVKSSHMQLPIKKL